MSARRRLIAGMVIAAAALALVASLAQTSQYRAGADLLFGRTTNADAIVAGGSTDTGQVPERAAATNLALASLDTVAARVKDRFPGSITVDQLRAAVSIKAQGQSDVVTVTAQASSPSQAARVANAFAEEIVALRRDTARADIQHAVDALQATLPAPRPGRRAPDATTRDLQARIAQLRVLKALQTGNVHLVERATPPRQRSSPKPLRNVLIAAFAALILGVFLVVALARFEDRVADEDELAAIMGASILARIPDVGRSHAPSSVWNPRQDPAFTEAFEFLRLNLELMGQEHDTVVVAVTSPAAADGKTTVVGWLARSLAMSEAEVVAVDLDLRKPDLRTYFVASRDPDGGVLDALLDVDDPADEEPSVHSAGDEDANDQEAHGRRGHTEEDVTAGLVELARYGGNARRAARSLRGAGREISESSLRRWKHVRADEYARIRAERTRGAVAAPHLRLVTGTENPDLRSGLLPRGRLQQLFSELRQDADYVLVDAGPVSLTADASAVAAAADGVILVVDMARLRRRDVLAARNQLSNARANLLGVVVNRATGDFPVYHPPEQAPQRERAPAGA